jgi:hypothetical protein
VKLSSFSVCCAIVAVYSPTNVDGRLDQGADRMPRRAASPISRVLGVCKFRGLLIDKVLQQIRQNVVFLQDLMDRGLLPIAELAETCAFPMTAVFTASSRSAGARK